ICQLGDTYLRAHALFLLSATGIIPFYLMFIQLHQSRHSTRSPKPQIHHIEGFPVSVENHLLILMFGLGTILQVSFTGMWTFLPFHLLEAPYHLSLQHISYFYLAYSLGIVGAPIAGWLTGKFSLSAIRVFGVIVLAAGMFITLGS